MIAAITFFCCCCYYHLSWKHQIPDKLLPAPIIQQHFHFLVIIRVSYSCQYDSFLCLEVYQNEGSKMTKNISSLNLRTSNHKDTKVLRAEVQNSQVSPNIGGKGTNFTFSTWLLGQCIVTCGIQYL